jgi:signal transduction histidine kinase
MDTATAPARPSARPGSSALLGVVLVAAAFAGMVLLVSHGGISSPLSGGDGLDATGIVLIACSTLPLVAWRPLGVGVFALTAGFGVALAAFGYRADLLLGATAALYLIAAHRERAWTRGTAALIAGCFAAYLLAAWYARGVFPVSELVHTGLAWAAAWFAGERTRLLRQHIADLKERATRAEREAERERLLAVAEERTRIARDLHDSAGHAISVIAVRAGAARLRDDPSQSRNTLEAIEVLARQTVDDIDRFVATLREDGGPVEDPVGLASLDTLVTRWTEAGLRIGLDVTGDARLLGAVADQSAYRILQEALTNAARHGTGSARIAVAWGSDDLTLTIVNPVAAVPTGRTGGGHGLIGMRERAGLLGGSVEAAVAAGEFRLRAMIPYGGLGQ